LAKLLNWITAIEVAQTSSLQVSKNQLQIAAYGSLLTMPISVVIVEDNPNLRVATSYLLRASPIYKVLGEYESAEELLQDFRDLNPDVVLMDIGLPGMSGIEATVQLKRLNPRVQIVILSVFEDDENVFQAVCAGACGYLSKPVMPAQLLEAVEQAFDCAFPMSPPVARRVLELFKKYVPPTQADYHLTDRELEVLELLAQGDDHKLIAEKLFLSSPTVRDHLRSIYDKLHVHSKSRAVAKALHERLPPKKV
jgi:DNA-binding NarL/FixJ family response regulator